MAEEANFSYADLIVSRTDGRGVIRSSNNAFVKISGYQPEELLGAPHKILRHEDMPKGVFHLIWQELLNNRPVGGYVKNKTKSGNHYWVFAIISPIKDGYISMRIKPDTTSIEMVGPIYADLLRHEKEDGATPEQSANHLLEVLAKHGFESYGNFMGTCLTKEMLARDKMLERRPNQILDRLNSVMPFWRDVGGDCSSVVDAYANFGEVPSNLRLQARNLNEIGASLAAIAVNFTTIAEKIANELKKYSATFGTVNQSLNRSMFLAAAQSLLAETETLLANEGTNPEDLVILAEQAAGYHATATKKIEGTLRDFHHFLRGSRRIKREFTGLSMTRVMCAIETAKVPYGKADHIRSIISELDRFQKIGDDGLDKICDNLEKIETHSGHLKDLVKSNKKAFKLAS